LRLLVHFGPPGAIYQLSQSSLLQFAEDSVNVSAKEVPGKEGLDQCVIEGRVAGSVKSFMKTGEAGMKPQRTLSNALGKSQYRKAVFLEDTEGRPVKSLSHFEI
jgi:hypothetical protein